MKLIYCFIVAFFIAFVSTLKIKENSTFQKTILKPKPKTIPKTVWDVLKINELDYNNKYLKEKPNNGKDLNRYKLLKQELEKDKIIRNIVDVKQKNTTNIINKQKPKQKNITNIINKQKPKQKSITHRGINPPNPQALLATKKMKPTQKNITNIIKTKQNIIKTKQNIKINKLIIKKGNLRNTPTLIPTTHPFFLFETKEPIYRGALNNS